MTNLKIFNNKEFGKVRVTTINNEPWFVGKEVAEILGYRNTRDALAKRVDDEDKKDGVAIRDAIGRMQNTVIINESGLYALILSSKLPKAKKFKRWITSEVLPTIRKHGAYIQEDKIEELLRDPDSWIKLLTELKEERKQRKKLQEEAIENKPKVLFANAVSTSESSILIGAFAKILKANGMDIGQNRLFKILRERGYLIRRKGADFNMPTQKSMELELFEIKETAITHPNGQVTVTKTPKLTGKGQVYFINKFLSN